MQEILPLISPVSPVLFVAKNLSCFFCSLWLNTSHLLKDDEYHALIDTEDEVAVLYRHLVPAAVFDGVGKFHVEEAFRASRDSFDEDMIAAL